MTSRLLRWTTLLAAAALTSTVAGFGQSKGYSTAGDGAGANQVQLTHNEANDSNPRWSPDGERIVFVSDRDGGPDIYLVNAVDGTNLQRLTYTRALDEVPSWSPQPQ